MFKWEVIRQADGFGLRAGGHFEAQNCHFTINFLDAIPFILVLTARLLLARVTNWAFLSGNGLR
jgi:hypothetical protein